MGKERGMEGEGWGRKRFYLSNVSQSSVTYLICGVSGCLEGIRKPPQNVCVCAKADEGRAIADFGSYAIAK